MIKEIRNRDEIGKLNFFVPCYGLFRCTCDDAGESVQPGLFRSRYAICLCCGGTFNFKTIDYVKYDPDNLDSTCDDIYNMLCEDMGAPDEV